ncbi:MAG: cytochrome c oxidase subunit II [Candidatus Omnitrophota bacterium]
MLPNMNYTVGASIRNSVDRTFTFILISSVILLVIVTGLMIYFSIRYGKKRHPRSSPVKQSLTLEILWTLIPTALVLVMFAYGYYGFQLMRTVPKDAITIKVTGRMWKWSFDYANGKNTDKLYVPVGKPVKLELRSLDVIHGFYVPAFRIKEDVVPGKVNYLWFKPEQMGAANIFCSSYCGQRHAFMLSEVIALSPDQYREWYHSKDKVPRGFK